jgi:hypothetical protein
MVCVQRHHQQLPRLRRHGRHSSDFLSSCSSVTGLRFEGFTRGIGRGEERVLGQRSARRRNRQMTGAAERGWGGREVFFRAGQEGGDHGKARVMGSKTFSRTTGPNPKSFAKIQRE